MKGTRISFLVIGWMIAFAANAIGYAQTKGEPTIYRGPSLRVGGNVSEPRAANGVVPASATAIPSAGAPGGPIPIKGPTEKSDPRVDAPRSPWASTLSMLVSLGMVVSLFLIAALMIRKSQPKQYQKLPKEVVEVLGRSPLGPRQNLVLLRFGSKLILVSQQPGETQSLGEIADAGEAARLAGLCEVHRPESVTGSFRDIMRQMVQAQPNTARASHRPSSA